MEDIQYRRTEGILYRHFKKIKRIERLKYDIENTKQTIHKIQQDLRNVNVELSDCVKAIDYSQDRVQSSIVTSSAVERELERITDKLLNELKYKIQRKYKLKARLRKIEEDVKRIEKIFVDLTEEEKLIVELKYGEKKTIRQIERILPYAKTTIHRKKREIIEYIVSQL
ncbi:hypothetical protein FQB35_15405 (plasmid) [Crassaminicella thermophila]|uniref:Sigma-70, region 4 n=1 Tax=Crassaminicella thermophila TaxID=2599308 RepID=A0A5C0SKV2_CRATE|nr:hypothetical protein [Crassaminicella thermophila]QEK13768.1 hypothetical protein FQB35_15405 [Crassaminicella thermophila]